MSVAHNNFQNISKKLMQLKSVVCDMVKIDFVGISENWLEADAKMSFWNVAPNIQELFRGAIDSKRKGVL